MRFLLLVAMLQVAHADSRPPTRQALSCPDGKTECDLVLVGFVHVHDQHVKWDTIKLVGTGDGKRLPKSVFASINIPHRRRLALKPQRRYRVVVAANAPFGADDLWIIDAKPVPRRVR